MYNVLAQILDASPQGTKRKLMRAKDFSQFVKYKYIPFFNQVDVDSLTSKLIREYGVNQEWIQTGNGTPFAAYSAIDSGRLTEGKPGFEKVYFLLDHFNFCVLVMKVSEHFFLVYPKKWFLDVKGTNWTEFKQIMAATNHIATGSYFITPTLLDDLYTGKVYPGRVDKFFEKWKSNWLADLNRKDDAKTSMEFKRLYGPDFFEFKNAYMKEQNAATTDPELKY